VSPHVAELIVLQPSVAMAPIYKLCMFFNRVVNNSKDPTLAELVNPAIIQGFIQAIDLWFFAPNTKSNIFGRVRSFLTFIKVCCCHSP
jgi:hypothetical protein